MKTTIEICDPLLRQAKKFAAREGITLRTLVERGLPRVLDEGKHEPAFKLRRASFKGEFVESPVHWPTLRTLMSAGNCCLVPTARRGDSSWPATVPAISCGRVTQLMAGTRPAMTEGNSQRNGPLVLCRQYSIRELWSVDRDFTRFTGFKVVNPLVTG